MEEKMNKEKHVWARGWVKKRNTPGASALSLSELAIEDQKEHMSFSDLLQIILKLSWY